MTVAAWVVSLCRCTILIALRRDEKKISAVVPFLILVLEVADMGVWARPLHICKWRLSGVICCEILIWSWWIRFLSLTIPRWLLGPRDLAGSDTASASWRLDKRERERKGKFSIDNKYRSALLTAGWFKAHYARSHACAEPSRFAFVSEWFFSSCCTLIKYQTVCCISMK